MRIETERTFRVPRLAWAPTIRLILIVFGVWILLGVFFGFQLYLNGRSPALGQSLAYSVRRYLVYALLTFPILWLCRRFPIGSGRWNVSVPVHAAGLGVFIILYAALRLLTAPAVNPETLEKLPASLETAKVLVRSNLFEEFWMYTSIVFVVLGVQSYRQVRERELREADLKRQMAEYELQILKLQLHPHFLFNTLNGISALMSKDVKTARDMLVRLSELLRTALAHTSDKEVSLREELEFVRAYLELEQMRLGERLTIELKIDPDTLEARVPNMLLQPLVENAIRHGVAAVRSGGKVDMAAARVDDRLRITIGNDGPPLTSTSQRKTGSGTGLSNTRARLRQLYGDSYQLHLADRARGGVELRLDIPFRDSPPAQGSQT
jgi:two-component system, LytTR family, sensor kinase